ncbi:conserved protein of unknown function [Ectopseudomonas oleovorans]|uniref:Uncharacterized protein n=1 Tax=Ectopseudomonas oleovorans TaxID=301 RepID=A0A653BB19_ECTOL|nr:conserved protein of unknown function [Pseudomonas oleovorans]
MKSPLRRAFFMGRDRQAAIDKNYPVVSDDCIPIAFVGVSLGLYVDSRAVLHHGCGPRRPDTQ